MTFCFSLSNPTPLLAISPKHNFKNLEFANRTKTACVFLQAAKIKLSSSAASCLLRKKKVANLFVKKTSFSLSLCLHTFKKNKL